jgi:quercetin dioxygenase-like cupin family protein
MFNETYRRLSMPKVGAAVIAIAACASLVTAQPPSDPAPRTTAVPLTTRDAIGMPGMEVTMSTVQYAPGASSPPHSHSAQVFVYVLEGHVRMQVEGGPEVTLGPGETFYETPTDVHSVSANASTTEPAKFLVFMLKDKNATTRPQP